MNKKKTLSSQFVQVLLTLACLIETLEDLDKKSRDRKVWVKSWLANKDGKGAYANILQEL